jgi:hypothetical protein
MRGVLPNCYVRPRFGEIFPGPAEGSDVLRFSGRYSQIMRTLDEFLAVESDAKVYNVSLGYNWASNFGINIDSLQNDIYRQLVRIQGEGLINVLSHADQDGAIIFSAPGNDSSGLATPMQATYASLQLGRPGESSPGCDQCIGCGGA